MTNRLRRLLWAFPAVVVLLATACGDDSLPAADAPATTEASTVESSAPTDPPTSGSESTVPGVDEPCDATVTEVSVGSPVQDAVADDRLYYCVQIPEGVAEVSFELTDLTGDLDLFVGYPDLETLQEGGVNLWWSDQLDTDDEVVVVDPSFFRGDLGGFDQAESVNFGPYYIEVSGQPSSFTLEVVNT